MLMAFFRISRCRRRYSISFCCCLMVATSSSGSCGPPSSFAGARLLRYFLFHPLRLMSLQPNSRANCAWGLPLLISNSTAWRLNSSLYTLFLFLSDIGFLLFSLGSRVRQIGAVSQHPWAIALEPVLRLGAEVLVALPQLPGACCARLAGLVPSSF